MAGQQSAHIGWIETSRLFLSFNKVSWIEPLHSLVNLSILKQTKIYLDQLCSGGHVESLKIEHCQYVDINFDMLDIIQPFYQVRLENIEAMSVNNVMLRQRDNLDIIIRNVKSRVKISGHENVKHIEEEGFLVIDYWNISRTL